jgi:hypothetical protein
MGYALRRLTPFWRIYYGLAGVCLLIPVGLFPAGRWINLAGALLAAALLFRERVLRRRAAAVA